MRQLLFKSAFLWRACLCCRAGHDWAVPSALTFSCVCADALPAHEQEWVSVLVHICSDFSCHHWQFVTIPSSLGGLFIVHYEHSGVVVWNSSDVGYQGPASLCSSWFRKRRKQRSRKYAFHSRDKALKQWGGLDLCGCPKPWIQRPCVPRTAFIG